MKDHSKHSHQEDLNESQLHDLEKDPVWALLDDAEPHPTTDVNPKFARNVMREIRLNHSPKEQDARLSLWQRLFAPKYSKIALTLCATTACIALIVASFAPDDASIQDNLTTNENLFSDDLAELAIEDINSLLEAEDDDFTEEMLNLANQDPFFISAEEIEVVMKM